ncbi:restriction endonuclease subunit S [Phaeobacter inhibens]|uniref:restriction endonuclease subunit S n=1 Tax=Phaeobacter inhibens TaxID=221822 RepID=UPI0021A508C2|nr:restriction endonuclease subunit S [Phaeobacter inhibens]UWR75808.1 restriction endonuclease subunit S [Phaeobacter inhibens]
MSGLPEGWEATTLGDLSYDISYGFTTSAASVNGLPKLLRITDIQGSSVDWEAVPNCSDAPGERFYIESGDIVIARTGATTGKSFLVNQCPYPAVFASYLIRVRAFKGVDPYYLWKFMQSPWYWKQITKVSKGTAQPGANASILSKLDFPLPPLAEQRRIVEKLDQLSARTRAANDHLTHVQTLATRAKKATLAAAFRGELTADWRAQTDATEWVETSIDSLLDGVTAGKNLRCVEKPPKAHEIGVVKVSAVTWGRFDETQAKTLPDDFEPAEKTLIEDGDFLFSRANTIELVGACAIVEEAPGNLYLSDKVLRLEMDDGLKPWVMHYLRSTEGRDALEKASSGNQQSMRNISQKALKQIVVPLPPLEEQTEIVRRIEAAFARIDRMVAEAAKALALLERLEQQLLAKAFRGELVPQDPNDEPASALLARIREARANAPKPKRTRKKKAAS